MRSMLFALAMIGFTPALAGTEEKEEGFRPLFNGKDTPAGICEIRAVTTVGPSKKAS